MRLFAVTFPEARGSGVFARLARALERSVAERSPGTPLELARIDPDWPALAARWRRPHDAERDSLLANTAKLEAWAGAVESALDGEVMGLLDCDLLVTGDLSEVELLDFDAAYTVRPPGAAYPFNGGVVFLRVGPASRAFMRRWCELNAHLLASPGAHAPLRQRFGGINQAAFGALLGEAHGLRLMELPCAVWNCEDESWSSFGPLTKIVHVKSQLRQACFGQRAVDTYNRPLVELWQRFAS